MNIVDHWNAWTVQAAQLVQDSRVALAPPAIVSGTSFLGVTWENWVYITTFAFTACQFAWWLWKRYREWRDRDKEKR